MASPAAKPVVLITGAAGALGRTLIDALGDDYAVVAIDRRCDGLDVPCADADLADPASVRNALATLRPQIGARIAAVLHLAAYFDFSGEDNPLYTRVNVEGTRHLLAALQDWDVEQFVYTSTMLVHAPGTPGETIDEDAPIAPRWAYPRSKAEAEAAIAADHGRIPYVLLRLAGIYDETSSVPTLAQQIHRIYARELTSHVYAGDTAAGQAMLHRDDMVDAIVRTIERRHALPSGTALLIGESEAIGYGELQDLIGRQLHGEQAWITLSMPAPLAKLGATLQEAAEPLIPDAIDHGEKPFIRPFMIDLASDHYALDIGRARRLLGWQPRHRLRRALPAMLARLKQDPRGWYRDNRVTPPAWLEDADQEGEDPESLRRAHDEAFRRDHRRTLWAPFGVCLLGGWLASTPLMVDYASSALRINDLVCGLLLIALGLATVSWRLAALRWGVAALGAWIATAPLLFWAAVPAVYINATLVGGLVMLLALAVPPLPNMSPLALRRGPDVPPGWDLSPSSWMQRAPIIALAFVGLVLSRHMAAYQLGHIDAVVDPVFTAPPGADAGLSGSEYIITSEISEAFPVADAGLGALVYLFEIVLGLIGAANRWRTMPWLVLLFAALIVPLGGVSIVFIIIQPILLGTYCLPCLIAAAAMLVQIPYAANELLATLQFLRRRRRAGKSLLLVLLRGDTDEGATREHDDFQRRPTQVLAQMLGGGVNLPWTLAACIAIGVWLMLTRLVLGSEGAMADADHLIGALVVTVAAIACAEVARPLRWLIAPLGVALWVTPFVFDAGIAATIGSVVAGLLLVGLCMPRGEIRHRWGRWNRVLV